MRGNDKENNGLKKLCDVYRKAFRVPENLNYYSDEDLKKAEKKFIRYCLLHDKAPFLSPDHSMQQWFIGGTLNPIYAWDRKKWKWNESCEVPGLSEEVQSE